MPLEPIPRRAAWVRTNRRILFIVLAEIVVGAVCLILAWAWLGAARSPAPAPPEAALTEPPGGARSALNPTPRPPPTPSTQPSPKAPGAASGLIIPDFVDRRRLNSDTASLEAAEARLLQAAIGWIRSYLENEVLPSVLEAERANADRASRK